MSIRLLRNAYDAGTLAATQPGITPIDPVTSTACGPEPVTVGSEHPAMGGDLVKHVCAAEG
jgi:hypothetical protein